jgi:hypothetical protein
MKKTFTQIKTLAVASLVCFSYYFSNAQCNNANIFGTSTAPAPQNTVTAVTGIWATEYHQVNGLVAGNVYQVSSSIPTDFLTIRHTTSNGPVVAFGTTPVTFTAPVSGTYFFHVNTNSSCGTNTSNRNLVLEYGLGVPRLNKSLLPEICAFNLSKSAVIESKHLTAAILKSRCLPSNKATESNSVDVLTYKTKTDGVTLSYIVLHKRKLISVKIILKYNVAHVVDVEITQREPQYIIINLRSAQCITK